MDLRAKIKDYIVENFLFGDAEPLADDEMSLLDGGIIDSVIDRRGLAEVLDGLPPEQRLRLPMREGNRSLNLSNAAAVVVYEAWRQLGFDGGA